jgi:hypothetical protein
MIIEGILNAFYYVFEFVFGWISLPSFPTDLTTNITTYLGYVFDNLDIIYLFIRPSTIKIALPILIAILNFERLYRFTMFIIRKLPFGIE